MNLLNPLPGHAEEAPDGLVRELRKRGRREVQVRLLASLAAVGDRNLDTIAAILKREYRINIGLRRKNHRTLTACFNLLVAYRVVVGVCTVVATAYEDSSQFITRVGRCRELTGKCQIGVSKPR